MATRIQFDWFLAEWLASKEMTQADLVRATDFPKAKVSELVNGKSRYNRDVINTIAKALAIYPYELLMHPEDANRLKQLRETAVQIAADNDRPAEADQEENAPVRKRRTI